MKVVCISCEIPFWQDKDENFCPFCCPKVKREKVKPNKRLNTRKTHSKDY